LFSAAFQGDEWYAKVLTAIAQLEPATAEQMNQHPLYETYAHVAQRPGDSVLFAQLGQLFRMGDDRSKKWQRPKLQPCWWSVIPIFSAPRSRAIFRIAWCDRKDVARDGSGISNVRLAHIARRNPLQHFRLPSTRIDGEPDPRCSSPVIGEVTPTRLDACRSRPPRSTYKQKLI
jgi:hypothetical protein